MRRSRTHAAIIWGASSAAVHGGSPLHHLSPLALAIWHLIREHDVLALSLLIFLEEMGIPLPLPGNMLLMYLGTQASSGRVNPAQTLAIMTLASILGSVALYAIAAQVGRPAVLRWGRYVGLDHKRVARIEAWLGRYGAVTIGLGRIMPGLRTPTSAVGGIFGVPLLIFVTFTSLAGLVWTGFWLILGAIVGRNAHLERYLNGDHALATFIFAGACLLVLPTIGFISARRQRQRERAEQERAAQGQLPPGDSAPEARERVEAGAARR